MRIRARGTTGLSYDEVHRPVAAALCGVVTITHASQPVGVVFDEFADALRAGPADGADQHTPSLEVCCIFYVLINHRTRGDAPQAQ